MSDASSQAPEPQKRGTGRGFWTTLAAVVTVLVFITGVDSLPDLFPFGGGSDGSGADDSETAPTATRAPASQEIQVVDAGGIERSAVFTIVEARQNGDGVSLTLSLESEGDQTLNYLYEVSSETTRSAAGVDRFQLMTGGEMYENTGQLGISVTERSNFRLACLPFSKDLTGTFVLEFDGARLDGDWTLIHVADEERFRYRRCTDPTVALPHFRIAVPGGS